MRAASWQNIERYRKAGLTVDDDFERGITPLNRACRTGLLGLCVVALTIADAYVVRPTAVEKAWQHYVNRSRVAPTHHTVVRHGHANV